MTQPSRESIQARASSELFPRSGCCSSCTPEPSHRHNHESCESGHHGHDDGEHGGHEGHGHSHGHGDAALTRWSVGLCGVLAAVAWACTQLASAPIVAIILYALSIIAGGWPLLRGAANSLRRFSLDMNVLMSVAVTGACILGDWGEAASLVFLYAISQWIEEASIRRSRHAITGLMNLAPQRALVRREGSLVDTEADEVEVGEHFLVRAGERVALDGIVVTGLSDINQAPVTGESMPVAKSEGSEVYAGTLNGGGVLEVRATRPAREGTVARIARLVAQTEREKSPRQTVIERFAARYTPFVLGAAVVTALTPPLFFHSAWPDSILRALALLVAACPCAFVLSGPVAVICALSAAARNGVLIRGAAALDALAGLRALAVDKTGTLTEGRPRVAEFVVVGSLPKERAVSIAAALERQSRHPLAQAVIDYAAGENEAPTSGSGLTAQSVEEVSGQGVSGQVEGTLYHLGRVSQFAQSGTLNGRAERVVERLRQKGNTVAMLCDNDAPIAVIGFRDVVRPEARGSLERLKQQGLQSTIVLSGDHEDVVREAAGEAGADEWSGALLPEAKLQRIHELSSHYGSVAMVGDGINDAPALAAADIGVAMGAAGSDAALEVADVALMGDDLSKLPMAMALAKRARGIIVQNIALAIAMKLVFVAGLFLGVWGGYSLIGGVIADVGATVLVTANGLRLLRGAGLN